MKVGTVLSALLAVTLLGGGPAVRAREMMTLEVSPKASLAPAHVTVRAYVETDPDNRALEVVAESEDFYRSSVVELKGRRAPRMTVIEYRSLPGGSYVVQATLLGIDGQPRATLRRQIVVVSGAGAR